METLELLQPKIELIEDYLAMLHESLLLGEDRQLGYLQRLVERIGNCRQEYANYLQRLRYEEHSAGLAPGLVPQTTFWLVRDENRVVGESRLRHYLTPALRIEGGNIGYFIRHAERRKGYGTRILALTLEEARAINLPRVLVTCDTDNIGSARIIRKNGGVFDGDGISPRTAKPVSQYWIELPAE